MKNIDIAKLMAWAILMDHHHEGIEYASPSYAAEKYNTLLKCKTLDEIMSHLDYSNSKRLNEYIEKWNLCIEDTYEKSED